MTNGEIVAVTFLFILVWLHSCAIQDNHTRLNELEEYHIEQSQ